MSTLRVIEKVVFGDGTPDELADDVPMWEALRGNGVVLTQRVDQRWTVNRYDDWDGDDGIGGLTEIEARWWTAVAIAAAAGCPPHWADMGMTPRLTDLWGDVWDSVLDGVEFIAFPMGEGHWRVDGGGPDVADFVTEFEARWAVADRLGIEWRVAKVREGA